MVGREVHAKRSPGGGSVKKRERYLETAATESSVGERRGDRVDRGVDLG
jgi:hypothetical protein